MRQRTVVHVAEVMLQQGVPVVQALQYRVELGQAVAKVIGHRPAAGGAGRSLGLPPVSELIAPPV